MSDEMSMVEKIRANAELVVATAEEQLDIVVPRSR